MRAAKQIYDAKLDVKYQNPYIDVDEWRVRTLIDNTTIPYRYVHGGFKEMGVKFSFCFPKEESFKGRFFQYLSPFPGPDEEMASVGAEGNADDRVGFALSKGAYFVETNMGSTMIFGNSPDQHIVWKSSAAAAEYSRVVAMEMYQCTRPYGYVYGGSGGGYKTMACIENTNAWDGAAPYVIGSPVSLPNTITLHAQGQRCLRHVFGKIVDALDAGGSGDMYAGLTEDEAVMLKEITQMGFPPKAWFFEAHGIINDGSLPVLTPGVKAKDPSYFNDFWTVPGYLGADPNGNAVRDRLQFKGTVKRVHVPGQVDEESAIDSRNGVDTAWQKMVTEGKDAWIELEEVPQGDDLYLKGVNIGFETGAAVGKQLLLGDIQGNCLTIGMCYGMDDLADVIALIQPGDKVVLDNSDYIAIQSYYRHQVPADLSFHAWDQFRDEDGKPTLPQRDSVMGYGFTGTGTVQDGNIQGKVIVTQAAMDESTCPWCGDWYRNKVKETMGSEEDFRIYYMEYCIHGDDPSMQNTRMANYNGALYQALLDLSDWVERGIEPLSSSGYAFVEGQIVLEEDITRRKGIQPKVYLTANDTECARVKVGETVTLRTTVEMPEGAGMVTGVSYAFEDSLEFPCYDAYPTKGTYERTQDGDIHGANATITHTYDQPGTYFASVRVQANRHGDANDYGTQVLNMARVRIVVE